MTDAVCTHERAETSGPATDATTPLTTAIPDWTAHPVPGVGVHDLGLPPELVAGLRAVARSQDVPVRSVWLAVHAKVVAALSGETGIVTGLVSRGWIVRPARVEVGVPTWRALVAEAHRGIAHALPAAWSTPAQEERLGVGRCDLLFAPDAQYGDALTDALLEGEATLAVGVREHGGHSRLLLRYDLAHVDEDHAARIAGYHLRALAHLVANPHADPAAAGLLDEEETRVQTEDLAGPVRVRPDLRAHELIERQAALRPDDVAAVQGEVTLTYRELNARANRLGATLLEAGLSREDVVAVVTERHLDWMAGVLGVLKAGGAYLPVDPGFPADRIARMLRRAECRFVVTDPGGSATLREALADRHDVVVVDAAQATRRDGPDGDLGVPVAADDLAYLYFTSGSTGEPKGAMCEHAGLVNHLYAKIEDLQITPGTVVAQIAPQCFDISLWQLLAGPVAGGRTLVVGQDQILDVERFTDTIGRGEVGVLQVVPSYLEALLAHLEAHPRELPRLRCVSATGEALRSELVHRWFAAYPGVQLVNAYGLTETSDDTNHLVMTAPPEHGRVPLGPPVANVHQYVVDENLALVPLGAPGLIAFSGVCVGRGYVNAPEQTAHCYRTDPYRPGQRLYLGGDHGRWLPGGELEFLGRRDHQVKISGFRIETGDIENALLAIPEVRDGAVVAVENGAGRTHLVACYAAAQPVPVPQLRGALGRLLPDYMVPQVFRRVAELPLTANGKVDRRALTALVASAEEDATPTTEAPRGATEQRLAAIWAQVLGLPVEQIGRHARFTDLGGNSLAAVKVAIALDRVVPLAELIRHGVLSELAAVIDTAAGGSAAAGDGADALVAAGRGPLTHSDH